MSCYFRHVGEVLAEARIEVTPGSRREIDRAFRQIAGVPSEHCPAVWKILKQRLVIQETRRELAGELLEAMRRDLRPAP